MASLLNHLKRLARISDQYKQRPDVRKIIENTGWLFSDSLIRLFFSLFVGAWVARYLGTESFGLLNLAIAYWTLALPLIRLGLDDILVRHFVDGRLTPGDIIGTAIYIRLLSSLTISIPLFVIVHALHVQNPIILLLTVILSIGGAFQSLEILNYWFQSKTEARSTAIARNTSFLATTALRITAIIARAPVIMFGALHALESILNMCLLFFSYRRRMRSGAEIHIWRVDWGVAKSLLSESWPLILASLAVSIYMRIDQIMLGVMLPEQQAQSAVGVYAAAVRISEIWYFIPTAIITSTFPTLLLSKKTSEELYRKRLQRLLNLMAMLSYLVAIPLTFLSGFVINGLYGNQYSDAAPILSILTWAGVWVCTGMVRSQILIAENMTRFSLLATLAGAIANIALNAVLIPISGAVGCAIATLISQIIAAHASTLLLPAIRSFGIMQTKALLFPNPFTGQLKGTIGYER